MIAWPAAPYVAWARTRPAPRYDLAASDLLPVTPLEWPALLEPDPAAAVDGAALDGALSAAIAAHHGVPADRVVTAIGSSGANFLALASAATRRRRAGRGSPATRRFDGGAAVRGRGDRPAARVRDAVRRSNPAAIAAALTPRTRLVVLTRPHNPSGAVIDGPTLEAIAAIAERARVHVLVDEVYLDTLGGASLSPAALASDRFISTSSLTKAYGLAGLRCGWALAAPAVAARMRAARAVVAPAPAPSQRLALRAFADLALLADRARRIIETNRSRVQRTFASRDDVGWVPPAAGTVAFPRLLRVADVDGLVDWLLVEQHTAVVPGRFSGIRNTSGLPSAWGPANWPTGSTPSPPSSTPPPTTKPFGDERCLPPITCRLAVPAPADRRGVRLLRRQPTPEDDCKCQTDKVRLEVTEVARGTGAEARPGRRVAVHYTGWLFHPDKPAHHGRSSTARAIAASRSSSRCLRAT